MWQALLAAAVAGSTGLVAKHLFKPCSADPTTTSLPEQTQKVHEDIKTQEKGVSNGGFQILSSSTFDSQLLLEDDSVCEKQEEIFRFSCSGSLGGTGVRICSRNLSKRAGVPSRGLKKGGGSEGSNRGVEPGRRGKRVGVCLKKRRTIKNAAGNRGSRFSDGAFLFNWGLGLGIMCMLSARKAEISKLNIPMGETATILQELKAELHKRKSSCSLHVSSSAGEVIANSQPTSWKYIQTRLHKSCADNQGPNDVKICSFPTVDDGECLSSLITEEPETEVQEMDQLEEELESELQKLPWCTVEGPHQEGLKDLIKAEISAKDDETDHIEQAEANGWNYDNIGSESKRSVVGTKRPIESEPFTYHLR
ncbi:hypothetical protein FEM48_Zijuj12G0175800 [Ziziphus jujuba var. spinosa]|uniref:Uncharacterized protein n=1 Tax=Ziziphus jujuba var. spinosa TaxID=714518 RepID=A0A978UEP4_ZIZJJ|nr:hypothetical protein FEM48_Zijuj12G0175800 [Ziziphus jujuba var. spinosa]